MAGLAFNWSESPRMPPGVGPARRSSQIKVLAFETTVASEAALRHWLDEAETVRASKFSRPSDRTAFVVTRATLRRLLADETGISPAGLRFRYTTRGKPVLATTNSALDISFSVSHTIGLSVIALARDCALGIDVEQVRTIADLGAIASRAFSASVAVRLGLLSPSERNTTFLQCWTASEALGKATGDGLVGFGGRFPIDLNSDYKPCIAKDWNADTGLPWTFTRLDLGTAYVATLACRQAGGFPIVQRISEDDLCRAIGMQ